MFKKKSNEKNTYGIVGLGRFGHALALELAAAGAELVVLDKEEEKVRELREYLGDDPVPLTLEQAKARQALGLSDWADASQYGLV